MRRDDGVTHLLRFWVARLARPQKEDVPVKRIRNLLANFTPSSRRMQPQTRSVAYWQSCRGMPFCPLLSLRSQQA
jgi:hypothetical protein